MSAASKTLLIVEDDKGLRRQLRWAFEGFEVVEASDRQGALQALAVSQPAVVLLDLGLPPDADGPSEGLATLEAILEQQPRTKVIMMTGQASRQYAVQAVAAGAYDFYQKPLEVETLSLIVERAMRLHDLEEEHRRAMESAAQSSFPSVIFTSGMMRQVLDKAAQFARSDATTLVLGDSGTGKELIAQGMHAQSRRRDETFVALNCAAIPDQLLESELFGHEKGAFTGAVRQVTGKVELADGGTLFLDEIGDLTQPLQAKLLRFLQEKVIERVGGREEIAVDVRVISATNKDLQEQIERGEFRRDLYYRLSECIVEIPPLQERPEDVIVIAHHYLHHFAQSESSAARSFSNDALVALSSHDWPGNVRELQNRIKGAVITAKTSKVTPADLDLAIGETRQVVETLKQARDRAEKEAIASALALAQGNVSKAARILDISRPKLYDLMRSHKLRVEA